MLGVVLENCCLKQKPEGPAIACISLLCWERKNVIIIHFSWRVITKAGKIQEIDGTWRMDDEIENDRGTNSGTNLQTPGMLLSPNETYGILLSSIAT